MFENGSDILQNKGVLVFGFAALLLVLEKLFPSARPLIGTHLTDLASMI